MHINGCVPDARQFYQEDIHKCMQSSCKQINAKIHFLSFSEIYMPLKFLPIQ